MRRKGRWRSSRGGGGKFVSLPSKELKRRLDGLKTSYAGVLFELFALLEHTAEHD
jgi:hypothetical protein